MLGLVFTELLEMVEAKHSLAMVDALIAEVSPASGGAYTSVGTYPAEELGALVGAYAKHTGQSPVEVLQSFGEHLVGPFARRYPALFTRSRGTIDFLESVDAYIHLEVRKLYPAAELPTFQITREGDASLTMHYRSRRALGDLAVGIMRGVARHYGETITIERTRATSAGTEERFVVRRVDP
jgi:hypothetical protein